MAVTVSLKGTTRVKKVVVGKPIRKVNTNSGSISNLTGVDTSGSVDGSVLIYNSSSGNYEATTELNQQEVNGGQY
jgi:hypothetical protein